MQIRLILIIFFLYLNSASAKQLSAIAVIEPTKGNQVEGTVIFTEQGSSVHVVANVRGLSPGKHGFHIHEYGDCSAPNASSAGGHFNPTDTKHGCPNNSERHVGDLGNLIAGQNGQARYRKTLKNLSLTGPDSIIGKAVIIHEKADDCHTQPSGNSGARLGCGVIGIEAG